MAITMNTRRKVAWIPLLISGLLIVLFYWYAWQLRHEKTLQEQRADVYLAVLDNIESAIVITDNEGVILDWNKTAERMFGWSRKEIVGTSVEVLMPPEHRYRHHEILAASSLHKSSTRLATVDCWASNKDGHLIHVNIRIRSVPEQNRLFATIDLALDVQEPAKIPRPSVDKVSPPDPDQFRAKNKS